MRSTFPCAALADCHLLVRVCNNFHFKLFMQITEGAVKDKVKKTSRESNVVQFLLTFFSFIITKSYAPDSHLPFNTFKGNGGIYRVSQTSCPADGDLNIPASS